nr:glycerophosphodiester phosphodiesterase family protein [Microbacterium pseudoresistens]
MTEPSGGEHRDADPVVHDNTALAFAAAHAAGAEYIETDCRLTADGDVVLFHDDSLRRLFADSRSLRETRTAELEALLADHGGMLSLRAALESFPDVRFNIDVKDAAAAEQAGRIVAPHAHRVLLTSFADATRRAAVAAALVARAEIAPAASAGRSTLVRLLAAAPLRVHRLIASILAEVDALQIPERYGPVRVFTPAVLRAAHDVGVEVHVWTVNDPGDMIRLVDAGADGIVTDVADLALRTFAAR